MPHCSLLKGTQGKTLSMGLIGSQECPANICFFIWAFWQATEDFRQTFGLQYAEHLFTQLPNIGFYSPNICTPVPWQKLAATVYLGQIGSDWKVLLYEVIIFFNFN